jgi:hypothetical protein
MHAWKNVISVSINLITFVKARESHPGCKSGGKDETEGENGVLRTTNREECAKSKGCASYGVCRWESEFSLKLVENYFEMFLPTLKLGSIGKAGGDVGRGI